MAERETGESQREDNDIFYLLLILLLPSFPSASCFLLSLASLEIIAGVSILRDCQQTSGEKMRNPSGQHGENERQQEPIGWRQRKKKANRNSSKTICDHIRHFLHKKCNQKVFRCKTTAKKCTKKCAARAKFLFFFANQTYWFFFLAVLVVAAVQNYTIFF